MSAIDSSTGMMAIHHFIPNETMLYDLYRLDHGILHKFKPPINQRFGPILTYDRLYSFGDGQATVYDYSQLLPHIPHTY